VFDLLVLDCVRKINQERTISNIYYLLKGKRSSQTLQDAHLFNLACYFGIYKKVDKRTFHSCINSLIAQGFLKENKESILEVTKKGATWIERDISLLDSLNGMEYANISDAFYGRLLLFIQTATNVLSSNHTFIPITDKAEVLNWVKDTYKREKHQLSDWLNHLYEELSEYLNQLSDQEASIFVDRITGYVKIGLSKEQLAMKYQMPLSNLEIKLTLLVHKLIQYITMQLASNSALKLFMNDLTKPFFLTDSAQKTYALLQKGFTIEKIKTVRGLKENTICDHIVEIALVDPDFPTDPYISHQDMKTIIKATETLKTHRLKEIKQALNNYYSYFQIRLTLAVTKTRLGKEGDMS
jgi:uncharacterized protein YpbB